MEAKHTATPQWQPDGIDGKAILVVNMADDPNDMNAPVIRVCNRDKDALALKVSAALNAHDDLVKALQGLLRECEMHTGWPADLPTYAKARAALAKAGA